jgi:hypothetical protein
MINKAKSNSRKQVAFTTSKGRRCFELRSDTDKALYVEVKRLAKVFADNERLGTVVSSRDTASYANLPSAIKKYFVKHGLREEARSRKGFVSASFLRSMVQVVRAKNQCTSG